MLLLLFLSNGTGVDRMKKYRFNATLLQNKLKNYITIFCNMVITLAVPLVALFEL